MNDDTCDICGKKQCGLQPLREEYASDDIKELCDKCSKEVNAHLWKLRLWSNKMNQGFLRRFMINLKAKEMK